MARWEAYLRSLDTTKKAFEIHDGSMRGYLEDGDILRISGFSGGENAGVGLGECFGQILPSISLINTGGNGVSGTQLANI